jgi:hypothetical protein
MSNSNFSNSVLHHQPGAAERVEVVNALELDLSQIELDLSEINVDLTSIETLITTSNTKLDEVKGAIESLELDLDLSTLEGDVGAIKTAVEAIDLTTLEGDVAGIKGELEPLTDKATGLTVTSTETAVVEVSISGRSTVTAWVVNTGSTNALEYKFIRYADATTDFSRVIVDWSELSANSAAVPIDIISFPGRYVLELRSADGTTANAALQAGG